MFRWPWRTPQTIRAEVDEELRYHLERRAADLEAAGLSPEAARRQAAAEFGDLEGTRRALVRTDTGAERASRRRLSWDEWRLDLRAAWRGVVSRPGLAAAAIATLALGVGLNAAVFSAVHGVLLRPLPYPEPERLLTLWQHDVQKGIDEHPSPGTFMDWRDRSRSFTRIVAAVPSGYDLLEEGNPVGIEAWLVTEGFFETHGLTVAAGRTFTPEEYRDPRATVVMLGHALWRSRYGGNPDIVDRSINLDGVPHRVVGVAPAALDYPDRAGLYAPHWLGEEQRTIRLRTYYRVIGRLAPGVTVRQARDELARVGADLAREYPRSDPGFRIVAVPLLDHLTGGARLPLYVLLGAVGLLLAIACANVASLLLARGLARGRELAVRAALGAGSGRLARLLLCESGMLALLGGTAGILLGYAALPAMLRLAPNALPRAELIRLDLPVLTAALAATALTALVAGLIPARSLTRGGDGALLRLASRTATGTVAGRALVVTEVAIALMLLVGAGLLGRSMHRLVTQDLGYETENRLLGTLHFWDRATRPEARVVFLQEIERRIAASPGIASVGAASAIPLSREGIEMDPPFGLPGEAPRRPGEERIARLTFVTPGYFAATGTRLVRGRRLEATDRAEGALVAVVNEALARATWPGEDPIGKQVLTSGPDRDPNRPVLREIVGVVADGRQEGFGAPAQAEILVPHAQWPFGSMTLVVHGTGSLAAVQGAVERAVWAQAPTLTFTTEGMESLLSETLATRRLMLALMVTFAACAAMLAAVGIGGLMSLRVSQRTRELGVRVALGAGRPAVVGLVLKQGVGLALAGVAIGIAGALALSRVLRTLLYETGAADPATFLGAALLLLGTAVLAAWIPARRATRVDPIIALRAD